jgi:cytochrome c peroxidase
MPLFALLVPLCAATAQAEPGAAGEAASEFTATIDGVPFTAEELELVLDLSPLPEPPLDPTNAVHASAAAARFGQALFFEKRLSGTGTVSCATCHDPAKSWTDGQGLASAIGDLTRNTMTLWNVAYNRWFFWDGRKDTLWSQSLGPLEDPREHGGSRLAYAHLVAGDPGLRRAYESVFGALPDLGDRARFPAEGRPVEPVPGEPEHAHALAWDSMSAADQDAVNRIFANLGKALAAYQRKLVSRRAPFDVFVEGLRDADAEKQRALDASALRGLKLFAGKARCHLCHDGPNFTDLEFHDNRVRPLEGAVDLARFQGIQLVQKDPFNALGAYSDAPDEAARAKLALVQDEHNVGTWKTPTLRNVALTAPYMHEGQIATLPEVVEFYSTLANALPGMKGGERLVQPLGLSSEEKRDLVRFLESLTDDSLAPELRAPPPTPYLADD